MSQWRLSSCKRRLTYFTKDFRRIGERTSKTDLDSKVSENPVHVCVKDSSSSDLVPETSVTNLRLKTVKNMSNLFQ